MRKTRFLSIVFFSGWILMFFLMAGCQKSGYTDFEDLPVVESYLFPDSSIMVKISQKIPYDTTLNLTLGDIDHLSIYITYNDQEYLLESLGEGIYIDQSGRIPVLEDSNYTLKFQYQGSSISSSTTIPSKPHDFIASAYTITFAQMDSANAMPPSSTSIDLSWTNSDESYYLVTIFCVDTNAVPTIKDSVPDNPVSSSMPLRGSDYELRPMMFSYFGKNRVILSHINPEYSTFYQGWMNNTQNYQEPPTNINNGLGIFTGINTDTLYIQVIKESRGLPRDSLIP